jgi:arylsulfatase A-like enzyme/tetratricopeptide (TPR) repeat protein
MAALALGAAVALAYLIRVSSPAGPKDALPLPGGVTTPKIAAVSGPRFPGANVLVVSIDTLRRDHLAPYGAPFETPAASRLAREGVVFEHAVSHIPVTLPSHASMFTGLYPPRHGVRDNGGFVLPPSATTLAERLLERGYETAAFVGSYVLASRWGLAQGHETYDDAFDYAGLESRNLADVERPGGLVVDKALAWLTAPRRRDRPFYLWVHLYDPHEPYAPPEDYRGKTPSAYGDEVVYADAQVGRLLAALDSSGRRRNTVVFYVSDHGEALGDHGESTHGIFLYGATLDVPMILSLPPGRGAAPTGRALTDLRVSGLARLVDVTPSVLDLVGLDVPDGLDGTSLLPLVVREAAEGQAATAASTKATAPTSTEPGDALEGPVSYAETYYPRFHYGWSELVVLQTARWKLVRAPRPELYDRQADPGERVDVSSRYPRIAATLRAELERMDVLSAGREPAPAAIDPEALERLRALGYVGGKDAGAAQAPRRAGPRPDPKDRLPLLQELLRAQGLRDAGRLDEALPRLVELSRKDPDNPGVQLAIASVFFRQKNADGAIAAGRRAMELDPDSATAVLDLAFAYQAAGRTAEAAAGFERVLALDRDNLKALVNLAEIHYARGELEEAFDLYERAARVAPRFPLVQVNRGNVALQLKRLDVAEGALRQAVALGEEHAGLHFNLAVIAEERGRLQDAMREYRAEVAAHPEAFKAWVNLGLLERRAGRTAEALQAFERAAGAKVDEMAGPYLLAETLAGLGRRGDALRWAEEARTRSPSEPRVLELLERLRGAPGKR